MTQKTKRTTETNPIVGRYFYRETLIPYDVSIGKVIDSPRPDHFTIRGYIKGRNDVSAVRSIIWLNDPSTLFFESFNALASGLEELAPSYLPTLMAWHFGSASFSAIQLNYLIVYGEASKSHPPAEAREIARRACRLPNVPGITSTTLPPPERTQGLGKVD
jgi:hypothetical protein